MVKKNKIRGVKFVLMTLVVIFLASFFDLNKTGLALKGSLLLIVKLLPIFGAVIFLTAIINYYIKPKTIKKHLGEKNGFKQWLIAISFGIFSHGPVYAWYPMIKDMQTHGVNDGLIVSFFYSRSIKLPVLPLMIEYFGWKFTFIFNVYIILGSFFQGWLVETLKLTVNKEHSR